MLKKIQAHELEKKKNTVIDLKQKIADIETGLFFCKKTIDILVEELKGFEITDPPANDSGAGPAGNLEVK